MQRRALHGYGGGGAPFGLDGLGYMHLSWGMHGDAFHYARTTTSVTNGEPIVFGPDRTMTTNENTVTYPQFLTMTNGDLLYLADPVAEATYGAIAGVVDRPDMSDAVNIIPNPFTRP